MDSPFGGRGRERGKSIKRFSLLENGDLSTLNPTDPGEDGIPFNEVGEGATYEADLFNESGDPVGTSFVEFEIAREKRNGDLIARVEDVLDFGDGNTLTLKGRLNVQKFEDLQPARLRVADGEGIFEGAKGRAILTQAELNVLDDILIDLVVIN